ncbi:amidase signature enzyme [Tricholoma matsutake]|nr:amidase signature enzyme [Tricholoma matsutake 945]
MFPDLYEASVTSLQAGLEVVDLVKDNIATVASDGPLSMNTTAGSYSLLGSVVPDVVKRLRKAGASSGSSQIASGWSGRSGGQASSAYYPNGEPFGSSTGSAITASIGLAAITLGTETNGSIVGPASYNNVVGIKPTVGLTSRAEVIPISTNQDTVGPLTRDISDAAIVLSIIAGKDPNDKVTSSQPAVVPDFTKALDENALQGKRIGVPRGLLDDTFPPYMNAAFEKALEIISSLGTMVVNPADLPSTNEVEIKNSNRQQIVSYTDFKVQINEWFAGLRDNPSGVKSLAGLIKFDDEHPDLEGPKGCEDQSS